MAHAVYGTVKAGKAIAAAAKGAAAGGPYGAAAGLAVAAGRHSGKLLAGAVLLLMLPILFVVMLPTLIFGGLSDSPSQPILNDNDAIVQNVNDITFAVNSVLGEGISDVEDRIALDFAGTNGDNYEIVNPYADDMTSNINAFIAQYCASKGETCADISLTDLEAIIRQNKGSLYSYTRTSETRTVEDDDPDTEDVVETKEELWYTNSKNLQFFNRLSRKLEKQHLHIRQGQSSRFSVGSRPGRQAGHCGGRHPPTAER